MQRNEGRARSTAWRRLFTQGFLGLPKAEPHDRRIAGSCLALKAPACCRGGQVPTAARSFARSTCASIVVLTMLAWFIAAWTNRRSPVRLSSEQANEWRRLCADLPVIRPSRTTQRAVAERGASRSAARARGTPVRPCIRARSSSAASPPTAGGSRSSVGRSWPCAAGSRRARSRCRRRPGRARCRCGSRSRAAARRASGRAVLRRRWPWPGPRAAAAVRLGAARAAAAGRSALGGVAAQGLSRSTPRWLSARRTRSSRRGGRHGPGDRRRSKLSFPAKIHQRGGSHNERDERKPRTSRHDPFHGGDTLDGPRDRPSRTRCAGDRLSAPLQASSESPSPDWREVSSSILRRSKGLSIPADQRDDLVQDALLWMVTASRDGKQIGNHVALGIAFIRMRWVDQLRKRHRRPTTTELTHDHCADEDGDNYGTGDWPSVLREAGWNPTEAHARLLQVIASGARGTNKIAEILGMNRKTIHENRRRLQKWLLGKLSSPPAP